MLCSAVRRTVSMRGVLMCERVMAPKEAQNICESAEETVAGQLCDLRL